MAVVAVKDSGIGMNPEMVENIFKLDVNNRRLGTEGEASTGLGLVLCKEFIEKHNGKLWIKSNVDGISGDKGTVFYFYLPNKSLNEEKIIEKNIVKPEGNYIKDLKILIAEDDKGSEMLITITVSKFAKEIIKEIGRAHV